MIEKDLVTWNISKLYSVRHTILHQENLIWNIYVHDLETLPYSYFCICNTGAVLKK